MRRVVVVFLVGLALAFGAFYYFSWPTTLSGSPGNAVGFDDVKPGEKLHVGLMDFTVEGRHEITIVTVKLNSPSAGIELDAARVSLGDAGGSIGSERGDQPTVEALPRAPGAVLQSNERGTFVVSFFATASGSFNGITITYTTGWLTRSVTLGPKVTVTVPAPATTPTPSPSPSPSPSF